MRGLAGRLRAGRLMRAGPSAAASACLALLVLAAVFVAVAGARAGAGVPTRALRAGLAREPSSEQAVLGTDDYASVAQAEGAAGAAQLGSIRTRLRQSLAGAELPLAPGRADWSGLQTGYSGVTAGGRSAYDGLTPPQLELVYRDSLGHYTRSVSGRLPVSGQRTRSGVLLQVAVTTMTARRFSLAVGSQLRLGLDITLVVTGIVRAAHVTSAFWTADSVALGPTHAAPRAGLPYWQGAVFVSPAELGLLPSSTDPSAIQLSWGFPLALGAITAAQAGTLQRQLSAGLSNLGQVSVNPPVLISLSAGGVLTFLGNFGQEQAAIAGVLDLLLVSVAAIGIIVVLVGTALVAERRRGEFALLHARGASRRQLAVQALRAAALAAIPAAVAGAAAARAVTPGVTSPLAWPLAALAVAAALAGLPLFSTGRLPSGRPGPRPGQQRGLRRRDALRRLVAEVTLIALAAGGLVIARQQAGSGVSADPLTSAAPVLVAVPAAIIVLRCYPLLARGLARVAARRRGVVTYVGLARAARASLTSILPAFALVLALVVVSFGGLVRAAIVRGEVAASWQQTGADAMIDTLDASLPLTPAALRAIAAVPGVRRTAAVTMTTGVLANGTQVAVAIVSPRQYAELIADTPGAAFPAAALAQRSGGGPVPAVATAGAVSAIGQRSAVLALGTTGRRVAIRVARIAAAGPAIAARAGGPVIILPQWAIGGAAQLPNLVLVTGPRLDGPLLTATARRVVPGAALWLRSAALTALAGAPLPHGVYLAYAGGAVAAAGFAIVVLLISLLLSAGSRDATLARLTAMGLSAGQGGWLALVETLPQVIVAAACGAGCGWALAVIVGPDLDLSPFTGSGAAVQIRAEPVTLGLAAAGLTVIALVTLAGEGLVSRRRGVARALRIGE